MTEKKKTGELGFSIVLLAVGVLALIESIRMFTKEPTPSSFGAIPLFLSSTIVFFQAKIIFFELRKASNNDADEKQTWLMKIQQILPVDILVIFAALVVYCILLMFKVGFEVSTVVFLVFTMTYLMRGQLLKNLIYTAISMAFILVVFRWLFQVILP